MEARIRHTDTDGSASFIYFLTYYYYSAVCAQAQPCATLPALHSARATIHVLPGSSIPVACATFALHCHFVADCAVRWLSLHLGGGVVAEPLALVRCSRRIRVRCLCEASAPVRPGQPGAAHQPRYISRTRGASDLFAMRNNFRREENASINPMTYFCPPALCGTFEANTSKLTRSPGRYACLSYSAL